MKPIFRHFKFFTKTSELYFSILIFIALFFVFLQFFSESTTGMSLPDMIVRFALQLIFYAAIVNLVLPINYYFQFFPLVLSFNGTRKRTFLGFQWGSFLLSLQTFLVALVLILCTKNDFSDMASSLIPFCIGILFGSMGIGGLLAGICGHFGKAALWIMMIVCGLVGGIVGYLSGSVRELNLSFTDGSMASMLRTVTVLGMELRLFIPVLGIVIYLIGNALHYLLIRKIAVRT